MKKLVDNICVAAAAALAALACGRPSPIGDIRADGAEMNVSVDHAHDVMRDALVDLSRALPPMDAFAEHEHASAAEANAAEDRGPTEASSAPPTDTTGGDEASRKATTPADSAAKGKALPGDLPTGPRGMRPPLSASEAEQRRLERDGTQDGPTPTMPGEISPHATVPRAAKPSAPAEPAGRR